MEDEYEEKGRQKIFRVFKVTLASSRVQFMSHVKLFLFVPLGATDTNPLH